MKWPMRRQPLEDKGKPWSQARREAQKNKKKG